ncbi:MAG: hypothetical protein D4R39_01095 [Methylophilaceae bacterium]|nr:MAG: hypothetical protein D4R39_01095 [Methylophilaceae bacterium]
MALVQIDQRERDNTDLYLRLSAASAEIACLKLEIDKLKIEKAKLIAKLADATGDNHRLNQLVKSQADNSDNLRDNLSYLLGGN